MKIIVASLLLTSSLSGVYLAKGQHQDYPELQHVRKVYVFNPHKFGYLAPRHIERGLQKSHCTHLVDNPMQADAILMPILYKSWLDKFGDELVGACVSSNDTVICDGGDETYSIHCDSSGCISGSVPTGGNESYEWVLIDPKTGKRMSQWTMKAFPSAKKVEEAVGCH